MALSIAAASCNAKDDGTTSDSYVTSESVAITGFSLTADIRVMRNLDSVYFSIDLEHGVVFNADSLPKGTNVTKLIPKITYPSSVTSAVIEMTGGTHREGTVNYYTNTTDTIDFTGDVTLTLGTVDDITKTYTLKVNVHQTDPDTIYWEFVASMQLPSRLPSPAAQKTVMRGEDAYCLIEESDGTFTLSRSSDVFDGSWDKSEVQFSSARPSVRDFTVGSDGTFYLIDSVTATLLESADGLSWEPAASGWSGIIGIYGDTLLGISQQSEPSLMMSWPEGTFPQIVLPDGFPREGFTSPIEFTNRWTPYPTIVVFGGYPFDASGYSPSWAFDGTEWVNIADRALPALRGMAVMPYYSYLNSATNGLLKEFEVYLAFGGLRPDGTLNDTVYVSYDHGITWSRAQEYMQLPEGVTAGWQADVLAIGSSMQSNLSNRWKTSAPRRRLPFTIDGDLIKWECPYIFMFGGYAAPDSSELITSIRSGVLQRLTYEPLF